MDDSRAWLPVSSNSKGMRLRIPLLGDALLKAETARNELKEFSRHW